MLIMARDRDYPELLESLRGKKVSLWTCTTCARLCYGLGGRDPMERLAEALRRDGIDVIGTGYTSAGCMESKLREKRDPADGSDVLVSLTCDLGARCVRKVFRCLTINPVVTFGPGILRDDGTPVIVTADGEEVELAALSEKTGPFVPPAL